MKNLKLVAFVLVLLIVSVSCNFFTQTSNQDWVVPGDLSQVSSELPIYDPAAPPPSPGAAALRALAVLEPDVAELQGDVDAAERATMNALLADLQAQLSAGSGIQVFNLGSQPGGAKLAIPSHEITFPAAYKLVGDFDGGTSTSNDAAIITAVVSGWNDQFTPNVQAGDGKSGSATETEGGATNISSIDLSRNADGSTKFGFGTKTEVTKNGVSTKTDVAASLDGQRCPNAEGQVSFTVKLRLGAESGGAGSTQDLTAFVRAEVNDDANIVSTTFDVTQGTRQVKDGRQIYVETGATTKFSGDDSDLNGFPLSNQHLIRKSQEATVDDIRALHQAGLDAALSMARTALAFAERNWLDGGCTKIEADSPGTVKPGSTTGIPVKVIHRFDGSAVPSKLEAVLSGEKSVEPTKLAKTPGTLTYTAPDEKGKSATIKLTATSRRGRATLTLTASTGGQAYTVSAQSGPVTFSGQICSLDKPFVLNGTFANGSETQSFTPSNATGGAVEESGNSGGCTQSGGGSYTVTFNEQGSGELQWTETVTGSCPPYSSTKTYTFNVPLIPAPDLSCP
jgi:hypothetical protein